MSISHRRQSWGLKILGMGLMGGSLGLHEILLGLGLISYNVQEIDVKTFYKDWRLLRNRMYVKLLGPHVFTPGVTDTWPVEL